RSGAGLVLQLLGYGLGLSILYLVLTNAQTAKKGRGAVELAAGGLVGAVRALVSPTVDPLSPKTSKTSSLAGAAAEAGDLTIEGADQLLPAPATATVASSAGAALGRGVTARSEEHTS